MTRPQKLLIANRGEIAVRIIRACAEMDIRSVAIYSDADRHALHVKKADQAVPLGPDPVAGYLNVKNIVDLAVRHECDLLHPGYGFLSENPALAEECEKRGVRFIGPSAKVIRQMGDKTQALKAAKDAGLPIIPGSHGNLESLDHAIAMAKEIGYPVMLKATSGGGGRGIRRCDNEEDLRKSYERVISEVTKAFGSAEIFMEKCIVNPRHIEVQILADKHGNVIHLNERDCSIQRRNQKLIEIAPSPQLTVQQRLHVCQLAVNLAKAVGYQNAGTVEFLLDQNGQFYFMEMNTRVQVEHTITETITGVDIVQEMIQIANGGKLSYKQVDVNHRGFSIQFRINAEDPAKGFVPSFGRITRYYAPGGPGIRTDSAIYTGYDVPPYFDSMLAKVIVWALTWEDVVNRSSRALKDMEVFGIKSTIPYYQKILESPEFKSGNFTTSFVESTPQLAEYSQKERKDMRATALAAAIAVYAGW
ncbi:MAG: acetyl-CoA carboxylase biotin carboxylase subunit [Magnetococcales bacterium]|nr:acetyl-CoA carboxylase biotin carboxylase subunit [Magnetococcales bacterium]NGZ25852.1 acetyl-CoA carboxylase biotin carboxylase subunit [Magnetococcales bacterium]